VLRRRQGDQHDRGVQHHHQLGVGDEGKHRPSRTRPGSRTRRRKKPTVQKELLK
jgi:hypothetical protein